MFIFLLGLFIGIAVGNAYGWMKYHYPESKELIRVQVARARADRAEQEAREEKARREIDDSIHERVTR
jgi:hypothetical protein